MSTPNRKIPVVSVNVDDLDIGKLRISTDEPAGSSSASGREQLSRQPTRQPTSQPTSQPTRPLMRSYAAVAAKPQKTEDKAAEAEAEKNRERKDGAGAGSPGEGASGSQAEAASAPPEPCDVDEPMPQVPVGGDPYDEYNEYYDDDRVEEELNDVDAEFIGAWNEFLDFD